jgi:hypothetical protein
MWQIPASRFSASELNLVDKTRTDGAVTLTASKKSLDKEIPVRTEVTVCTSLLEIPQNHSFSFYKLLLHELFALSIHWVAINILKMCNVQIITACVLANVSRSYFSYRQAWKD